ncbi:UDP-2,3-diacylglucosamine diphosphatase [Parahaliea sp. F7430]|uniref:UDP-2,3-diacylglucosamine hydrolase n=1 Tax=Sediminihaliea albiluteola TaxID=2758564 RepID=A0A7W2YIY8_9GAMM|nr:UDP-2,3-diacylglucosamine diphosphatase [Sediminihaliea albiluteola]MBA6412069.1 UDP-2,3-diacylglucosamine diphosphatase [Sediminihaliea albiluteola]
MSSTWFISDLHLDPSRPAITRALGEFLDARRDCQALYILGDFFEAWVGDDDDAPLAAEVADMLAAFSAAGPALYLMQGNRDFLLGPDFCQRVGATLLPDPSVIDLYGSPVLLMHGDSLCTADQEYQQFRQMVRSPQWQAQLLAQPLADRRALADKLRGMSQEANSNKAEDIMDVTPSEVEQALLEHQVSCMIHGHTHRPKRHQHRNGQRWVLGDWGSRGWAIEATADSMQLIDFAIRP